MVLPRNQNHTNIKTPVPITINAFWFCGILSIFSLLQNIFQIRKTVGSVDIIDSNLKLKMKRM